MYDFNERKIDSNCQNLQNLKYQGLNKFQVSKCHLDSARSQVAGWNLQGDVIGCQSSVGRQLCGDHVRLTDEGVRSDQLFFQMRQGVSKRSFPALHIISTCFEK